MDIAIYRLFLLSIVFEKLLTYYLVLPFLSSFEVTFFTRILFAVGVIYIIARTCYALWNKEQISLSHLYIALLLVLIWAYYRFYSDAFTFTYVIDNIAFVDIVALYAVLLYFTWSAVWVITKYPLFAIKRRIKVRALFWMNPYMKIPKKTF